MKHYYIVTGVDKKKNKINTRIYSKPDIVAEVIKTFSPEVAMSPGDIEFDAQSKASHGGALIINKSQNFAWSIFYI